MSNQLKAKYKDIVLQTDKAVLFLFSERQIWLPKKLFKFYKKDWIIIPEFLAKDKGIDCQLLYHKPEPIEPVFNQQAIDDLVL